MRIRVQVKTSQCVRIEVLSVLGSSTGCGSAPTELQMGATRKKEGRLGGDNNYQVVNQPTPKKHSSSNSW